MNLSVCIDALFAGKAPDDAMKTLSSLGYDAYEFWGWTQKDIPALKRAQALYGLRPIAFCTKVHGLTDESQREAYVAGLSDSLRVAKDLGCRLLISQVGDDLRSLSRDVQQESIIAGLHACIPLLESAGMTLLIEPLSQKDHKGTFMSSSAEAFAIVATLSHPSIRVLYDIYHQQITEGNILATLCENIASIGHIHAAGVPARNELNKGELHYPEIFRCLADIGYQGAVGLEYFPSREPEAGLYEVLSWVK